MLDSPDDDEKEAAAQALGKIGINSPELVKDVFPKLVEVLEHAKEASCGGIISAFGAFGFNFPEMVKSQIPKLANYLNSTNPITLKNAVMAFGIIGMTRPALIREAVPRLEELTQHPDREISLNAKVAISKTGDAD